MLVSVKAGVMETMPIAGTRPRGKGHEDLTLEQDLLNDKKELAEHMMLVDLARNDLGSVAAIGFIEIKDFKTVHRFSHVMHIVSRVQGTLKEGKHSLDAFKAVFPAGTISGAPKIRAMEIIDGLETSKRHLYGGAIIAVDAKGDLESCIAIRMTRFIKAWPLSGQEQELSMTQIRKRKLTKHAIKQGVCLRQLRWLRRD